MEIEQANLIAKLSDSRQIYHLAKTPLVNKDSHAIVSRYQPFVAGFNVGGRPMGLWVARGSTWLNATLGFENPNFPPCCYLYEIIFDPAANILIISDWDTFAKFDEDTPNYWLNLDFYNFNISDRVSRGQISINGRRRLTSEHFAREKHVSMRDNLISKGILFTSREDALANCDIYRENPALLDRFRYKDWDLISAKYDGVLFDYWDAADTRLQYYIWYQSLDVPSGCIWNSKIISKVNLKYYKIGVSTWVEIQ